MTQHRNPPIEGTAPRPAPALTVAIVGHRPGRIDDPAAVQARVGEILGLIRARVGSTSAGPDYAAEPPRLGLISALAEGADRLGAAAALEAGFALEAVLPFPVGEYERDFDHEGSREEFHALLARAASTLILDGKASARDRAYEAVGKALLDNCDLLIAIWDGKPGRGRGGTRDVVEEAVRRAIPVITVAPDGGTADLLRSPPGATGPERLEDLVATPLDGLDDLIADLVGAGPRDQEPGPTSSPDLTRPPSRPWHYSAYPLMLKLVGAGPKRAGGKTSAEPPPPPPPPPTALDEAFAWWDGAAIVAAQAFRSAVIVNFALAALAVVLAALSLFAGDAKWIFVVAEVATILLLLTNTWHAGRRHWQARWLESREVAEMLRVCLMLRKAGVGRGLATGETLGWNAWYVLALARASPLQAADLSESEAASRSLVAEVSGQATWNEATAHRMHFAGHRIERIGEMLFVTVLAAAISWLVLRVIEPHAAHDLKYALTAVTAGLPALATASYGIRVILDFAGIAERSRRMAAALRASLAAWNQTPPSAAALQEFTRRAADVMLGDVAAWRLLAEGRRLTIPG